MQRGDLITVALQGDAGKPRPALVVQADHFADLSTNVVLPLTTTILGLPLVRVTVEPSEADGATGTVAGHDLGAAIPGRASRPGR